MALTELQSENTQFQSFLDELSAVKTDLSPYARAEEIRSLDKLVENFKRKTEDFYRTERKLNIGVVGQVKAGKSSFLNTLLFDGKEILPKAATPKTAALTKMEYSEENIIQAEYYSVEEWDVLEENAAVDLDDEIYSSAKELVGMVRRSGLQPKEYLEKKTEQIHFDSYDELIASLNDYVGEDGRFTPIVKAVTLYLNKAEFEGLSIVDTPGLNDPIVSRTMCTKRFIELCDVVFFLSQSGSFLDKSDWILLSSQLPQKGVKRLVLVASKYDSGIRDILRETDEDDLFGGDENTADNIPAACKIIKRKLRRRAKTKVEEFAKDLEQRGSSPELIKVIRGCSEPVLVSALACGMAKKNPADYSPEEKNVYFALKQFSKDLQSDLRLLGNFDQVQAIFDDVVQEKEKILREKAGGFIPNTREECRNLLRSFMEKAEKRIRVLRDNDREQFLEQRGQIEKQMGGIKADIAALFGELNAKLESEKAEAVRELREASKDYLNIKERTGSVTRHGSYTTGHLFWKKTHHYSYEEHYSYCIAADAVENLNKYALEAASQAETVFTNAIQLKEMKRRLLNLVVSNFDMGSEKYDSSLFRIMVEETVNAVEFPVFRLDISDVMNSITGRFSGEIKSSNEKNELSVALSKAISQIYDELCIKCTETVRDFKARLNEIGRKVQGSLLSNIEEEFNLLLSQCEDKEREIKDYQKYESMLQKSLDKLR